jgi:hypothetical protein
MVVERTFGFFVVGVVVVTGGFVVDEVATAGLIV